MTEKEKEVLVEEEQVETKVDTTVEETTEDNKVETEKEETEVIESDKVLPKSEEELKKLLQSASSKAKNEILKEIGLNKVSEIKELLDKGYKYDDIVKEAEELKGKNSDLLSEIKQRDNNKLIKEHNIPEASKDLFIKLVDEMEGEETREEKALKVKEQLLGIVGVNSKIGSEKTQQELTPEDEMKKLRRL